jgi:hypothetical protein
MLNEDCQPGDGGRDLKEGPWREQELRNNWVVGQCSVTLSGHRAILEVPPKYVIEEANSWLESFVRPVWWLTSGILAT